MILEILGLFASKSLLKSVNECAVAFDDYQQALYECTEALVEYQEEFCDSEVMP